MSSALAIAPLGRCHPRSACYWCGQRLDPGAEFELVVVRHTQAYGWRCTNHAACNRRRMQARQLGLF